MLSDDIRARIGQLHRLVHVPLITPLPAPRGPEATERVIEPAVDRAIDFFAAGEPCSNASGTHLRFSQALSSLWPAVERATERAIDEWSSARVDSEELHGELAAVVEHFPRGTMFLDLETCGFAGSMVFLAGVVWRTDDGLRIDQLFARDYSQERALLETLWQIAARNRVLVTFNGKSFDWPMVHDRSTRHRLGLDRRGVGTIVDREPGAALGRHDSRPELLHCDLLHHARRRWKGRLPNCKLQTLERFVCGRRRHADLAGADVPWAYHHFVRTGATREVNAILRHNALDLLTLVQLALRLAGGSPPAQ